VAGHALVGVVIAGAAHDGADDDKLVHHLRHLGELLANLDARDVGADRVELAANFHRRVGFQVPHVKVRRAAGEIDIDNGPVRVADAGLRLGRQQVRQGQAAAQEGAADGEEITAIQAVAEAAVGPRFAEDGEHGLLRVGRRVRSVKEGHKGHCGVGVEPHSAPWVGLRISLPGRVMAVKW
jgi:hypothetical protein